MNDYYLNGLERYGTNSTQIGAKHKVTYSGKEFNDELGLNWYDHGWRGLDPALGRWYVSDLEAEQRDWLSPYNYVQNNPIIRIDPDGALDTKYVDRKGEVLADIDDGSDEIYVVEEGNEEALRSELIEQNVNNNIQDSKVNAEIGEKYGFKLSELAKETFPEDAFTGSGHTSVLFRAGYHTKYEGKSYNTIIGAQPGGSAYYYGGRIGKDSREKGHMNTFEPKIKDNKPKWGITKMIQANSENLKTSKKTIERPTIYTVKSGDNLTDISKDHNTTIKAIQEKNNIKNPHRIKAGEKLTIPITN